MSMTARGTVALLAVLGGLAAWLWFVELDARRTGPPTSAEGLLGVPPAAVARVEIEVGDRHLVAVRRDGEWTDGEGRPWQGGTVSDLVDALGTLRPLMVVDPDPREPADYGLGPGAARLHVVAGDGSALALEVGNRNPAATAVYARRDDRPEVILVGALLQWELEKVRETAPSR